MIKISEHKCITCKYFDYGDNKCTKKAMYLNSLNEYSVISECDSYQSKEGEEK